MRLPFLNSEAVGWNSWVSSALKAIFWGENIFESTAWFFVIILKFILTAIIKIKIHEKKILNIKKFHFRRPIFYPDSLKVKIISNFSKILIERRFEFLKRQGVRKFNTGWENSNCSKVSLSSQIRNLTVSSLISHWIRIRPRFSGLCSLQFLFTDGIHFLWTLIRQKSHLKYI